ncbi:hypothetical protein LVJ94_23520 [Pendulispora rubella]|uniref:Uncharacterized protein n=1 Tax=Pendulispora rubella TaxID=2741070 RepID=A0ABZ2LKT1_9BACT
MDSLTFPTKIPQRPNLTVTAQSELMKNYLGALPAAPDRDLFAVHDSESRPIVLSFSPGGRLFATHHDTDGSTGWRQVDLTPGLEVIGTPVTIAAGQLPGGNVFLCAGVRDKGAPSKAHVAIAGPLSPDIAKTDWSHLVWAFVEVPGGISLVEKILVGPVDDGQGFGIPTMAVSVSDADPSKVTTFVLRAQVDPNSGAVQWRWVDFPTPTVKAVMKDFALGTVADLGAGVYMLYEGEGPSGDDTLPTVAAAPWLVFKTFPDERGRSFDRQLLAPSGARCLATAAGDGKTTSLFVAGAAGVNWFAPTNQAKRAKSVSIAASDRVPEILPGGLVVHGDPLHAGTTSVWVLAGEDLYTFDDGGKDGAWTTPILFRTGVAKIAPLANQRQYANELVYIGTDIQKTRSLLYMWQDPSTTLWKSDAIPLASTNHLYEFNCYTTHLSFEDERGEAFAGRVFRVSASSRVRLTINGVTHVVDETTDVEVVSDLQGNVTLINQVCDLATPLLHLRGDFFDGVLDVDPAHNVVDKLKKVNASGDIPVLPKSLPNGLQGRDVVDAVKSLSNLHPQSASANAPAVRYRISDRPAAMLRTDHLPPGGGFSMSFTGDGFRVHEAGATPLVSAFSFGSFISDIAGDCIEFLMSAAHRVTHFAVKIENDVVSFVANLGETAVQFVVKTAEEVYKLVTWVFHKIKVVFEELIQWLGYLFEWKDIWETHKAIAAMARHGLDYVTARADAEVALWEKRVDQFFEHLSTASQIRIPKDLAGKKVTRAGAGGVSSGVVKALKSPIGNWSFYQLQHGGLSDSRAPAFSALSASDEQGSLIDQLRQGFAKALGDVGDAIERFATAWHGGGVTLSDVGELFKAPLVAALEPLRPLVKKAFGLIRTMLGRVRSDLDTELPVPFLGTLYKWITALFGGEENLTFLNGMALLVAIPTTLISKIAGLGAPFSGEHHGLCEADTFDQLFGARTTSLEVATPRLESTKENKHYMGYIQMGGLVASCVGVFPPLLRTFGALVTSLQLPDEGDVKGNLGPWVQRLLGNSSQNNVDTSKGMGRLRKNMSSKWAARTIGGVLLALSFVCDLVQFATTVPLPQKDMPEDSAPYILRVFAYAADLVLSVISYGLGGTSLFKNFHTSDWIGSAVSLISDLVSGVLAVISAGLAGAEWQQWIADTFSSVGGLVQGVGEICAVVTQNTAGEAKIVPAILTGVFTVGGLALAETGTGFYIHLAVTAGDSDGVAFTNPGG